MSTPDRFVVLLGSSRLSLVSGLSGAGRTPEDTWNTPGRDAAFVAGSGVLSPLFNGGRGDTGHVHAHRHRPLFLNVGYAGPLTVPARMLSQTPAEDPRMGPSVPDAEAIVRKAAEIGTILGEQYHTLWLGECIPGGTTHALCILRAHGFTGRVSSSANQDTAAKKEAVWQGVSTRCPDVSCLRGTALIRETGDPVMAAAQGLILGFPGDIILCGATQMSAVALLAEGTGNAEDIRNRVTCAMTDCVWQDSAADVAAIVDLAGIPVTVSPVPTQFVQGSPPSRACIQFVKEGFGAGGALAMARRYGYAEEKIEAALAATVLQH